VLVVLDSIPEHLVATLAGFAQPGSGFVLAGVLPAHVGGWRLATEADHTGFLRPLDLALTNVGLRGDVATGTLNAIAGVERGKTVSSEPIVAPRTAPVVPVLVDGEPGESDRVVDLIATRDSSRPDINVEAEIATIMAAAPVEVSLMKPTPSVTYLDTACERPKHVEVLAYLAANNGTVAMSALDSDVWGDDIATNTRASTISRLRSWLKEVGDEAGATVLADRRNQGTYELAHYQSDWARFSQLRSLAARAATDELRLRCMDVALSLVSGEPCSTPKSAFGWFTSGGFQGEITAAISDVAVQAARLADEQGDGESALRYATIGKRANKWDQHVRMAEINAYASLGRTDGVVAAYNEASTLYAELGDFEIDRLTACYEYAQQRALGKPKIAAALTS
jgi:hypothetical protein